MRRGRTTLLALLGLAACALAPAGAQAATITISDPASCAAAGGSWVTFYQPECAFGSYTVASADTLQLQATTQFSQLTNEGTLLVSHAYGQATQGFVNHGTATFDASTFYVGNSFDNTGSITLDAPAHLQLVAVSTNEGTLRVEAGATLQLFASLDNEGVVSLACGANVEGQGITGTPAIHPDNCTPSAGDDYYELAQDAVLTTPAPGVLGNDGDENGDTLTAALVDAPAHGTLSLAADGSFTYTPAAGSFGYDSFTYRASDGTADSNLATVTLYVKRTNVAPVVVDDTYTVAENGELVVPASSGVLANDSDADHDPLIAFGGYDALHGGAGLDYDGSFVYDPEPDYHGPDTFTYVAFDGFDVSAVATVHVQVDAAPSVAVGTAGTCLSDGRSASLSLALSDPDTALSDVTVTASSSDPLLLPPGRVQVGGTGGERTLSLAAARNRQGTATVTVTVDDGVATGTTTVTVVVGGKGADVLAGTDGPDVLLGQKGADTLSGLGGDDLLCGGAGRDQLTGGLGADRFSGGAGKDVLVDLTPGDGDSSDGS
jgi:VCBS repeat-containing protein